MRQRINIFAAIYVLSMIYGISPAYAQDNYVRNIIPVDDKMSGELVSTTYYDKAGREVQKVIGSTTPSGSDMASYILYDELGRKSKVWAPVPVSGGNGLFRSIDELKSVTCFHHADYTYEASSLGRLLSVTGVNTPGASVHKEYSCTPDNINRYIYDSGPSIRNLGPVTYGLYSEAVISEDNEVVKTYKDTEGHILLERRYKRGGFSYLDTYYIYDSRGRLACVVPPAASSSMASSGSYGTESGGVLDRYAYFYEYDKRGNRTAWKIPGLDWSYAVYDAAGRIAMTQSPNMREAGEWRFTKYDGLGRVILEGTAWSRENRDYFADKLGGILMTEGRGDVDYGYTRNIVIGDSIRIDKVHFYGNYNFIGLPEFSDAGVKPLNCKPHDLTGTFLAVTSGGHDYELSVYGYDSRGRVNNSETYSSLSGIVRKAQYEYNFLGQPVFRLTDYISEKINCSIVEEFLYDNAFREKLRRVNVLTGGLQSVPLHYESVYDEFCRESARILPGGIEIRKSYKDDGRLSSLTSPCMSQSFRYDSPVTGVPRFDGSMSEIRTEQYGDTFDFSVYYDDFGRMELASAQSGNGEFSEAFTYDDMGNITSMMHYVPSGLVNAVDFEYDGNMISSCSQMQGTRVNSIAKRLYPEMVYPAKRTVDIFKYDLDGNETRNMPHNMTNAGYNNMNLPEHITLNGGNFIKMKYLSDGRRVYTEASTFNTSLLIPADTLFAPMPPGLTPAVQANLPRKSFSPLQGPSNAMQHAVDIAELHPTVTYTEIREGDILIINGKLSRIDIPGGYISVEYDRHGGKTLTTYCHVTDYLGSVRTTYRVTGESDAVPVQHIRYMPSGAVIRDSQPGLHKRKFTGKEQITMHGWNMYDSGARFQYRVMPRFSSIDPLCEKYYNTSPYAYCLNNPVRFVDPDGRDWYEYTEKDGKSQTMWRKSQDKIYKDDNGNTWNNIGENYLSINGDNATLFTQHTNSKGGLYLSSSSYNLANEKSANALTSTLENILSKGSAVAGGLGGYAEGSNATFRLTNSKGALDFKFYGNGWKGNQWVMPNSVSKIGKGIGHFGKFLGGLGVLTSAYQFRQASTLEGKLEHGLDALVGGMGFVPMVGTGISLYWSFGGKKLHYMYVNKVLIPQIKMGINPGLPTYQPFK